MELLFLGCEGVAWRRTGFGDSGIVRLGPRGWRFSRYCAEIQQDCSSCWVWNLMILMGFSAVNKNPKNRRFPQEFQPYFFSSCFPARCLTSWLPCPTSRYARRPLRICTLSACIGSTGGGRTLSWELGENHGLFFSLKTIHFGVAQCMDPPQKKRMGDLKE